MADPVSLATGAQVVSGAASGLSNIAQGRAQAQQARANAYIGETRAIQTATEGAFALADDLASLRATMATNGQQAGPEFWREIRKMRGRQTRTAVANERQLAADYRTQARGAIMQGFAGSLEGFGMAARGYRDFDLWKNRDTSNG